MKKKVFLFIIVLFLTGCTGKLLHIEKFSPDLEGDKDNGLEGLPLESMEYGSIEEVPVLDINDKYYVKCRNEYESKIRYGYVVAENNGVIIESAIIRGTDKVYSLSFEASIKNKDELIEELNVMLRLNDYEEISKEEFDGIPLSINESNKKIIGKIQYYKQEVNGRIYLFLSKK